MPLQYMKDKPHKWGFKYWVMADSKGYTIDFDIYAWKEEERSQHGLAYDVVMALVKPCSYKLFCDNFYSSPSLFEDLLVWGIVATGTL